MTLGGEVDHVFRKIFCFTISDSSCLFEEVVTHILVFAQIRDFIGSDDFFEVLVDVTRCTVDMILPEDNAICFRFILEISSPLDLGNLLGGYIKRGKRGLEGLGDNVVVPRDTFCTETIHNQNGWSLNTRERTHFQLTI